jgi:hypothetical protein
MSCAHSSNGERTQLTLEWVLSGFAGGENA